MFGRRRRGQRQAQVRREPPRPGQQPWLEHGLASGQAVACEACGTRLRVRLHRKTDAIVATHQALRGLALICTGCGRVLCSDCAFASHPNLPKCDSCRAAVTVPIAPTGA